MIDVYALNVWLERHPITPDQMTDVVLAHLLAEIVRVGLTPRMVVDLSSSESREEMTQ